MFKKLFGKKTKTENNKPVQKNELSENPTELLMVKLFFEKQPVFNDKLIEKELKKRFEEIEFPNTSEKTKNSRHYFFKDYAVKFAEGNIPAQATIFIPDENKIDYSELITSFRQSWNWQQAENIVKNCSHEILLTDLMSRNLDYKKRIEYFQKFVVSIVSAMKPTAVWIRNSEVILEPNDFIEKSKSEQLSKCQHLYECSII